MNYDCLIVDDEEALSQSTCEYFNMFEVRACWVADAKGCLRFFDEHTTDLILLDINLGGTSGFDLCRRLREITSIPILFISARQSDDDMLLALSIGGDDYIQKPYSLSVLLAKVKAVLGRYRATTVAPLAIGGLTLDEVGCSVALDGQKVELKMMEFKLLSYLMKNHDGSSARRSCSGKCGKIRLPATIPSTSTSDACARNWSVTRITLATSRRFGEPAMCLRITRYEGESDAWGSPIMRNHAARESNLLEGSCRTHEGTRS